MWGKNTTDAEDPNVHVKTANNHECKDLVAYFVKKLDVMKRVQHTSEKRSFSEYILLLARLLLQILTYAAFRLCIYYPKMHL